MVNGKQEGYAGEYALVIKPTDDDKYQRLVRNGGWLYRKISGDGPLHVYVGDHDASVEIPVGIALDSGWRIAEADEVVTRPRVTLYLNNWPPQNDGFSEADV